MRFNGDQKVGQSILHVPEKKFIDANVKRIPRFIETYHLTYMTIVWSGLIVLFGFLAQENYNWLWGMSACIFLQWVTDAFDGAVGRLRNTGLIKWGYYMDHFLDYIFLCSIIIAYSFIIPPELKYLVFFIFAIVGAFIVNSYLSFAATNEFRVSYLGLGPTEARIAFIGINGLLGIFGKTYMAWSVPLLTIAGTIGLIVVVYRTQKYIWDIDMKNKQQ